MLVQNVFRSCRKRSTFSSYRSLSTVVAESSSPAIHPQLQRSTKSQKPKIDAAVILNRSPIITRTPSLFERAYYAYQARIRRSLHNPFPFDFYFKQGSLLETRFNLEERKRERRAFGPTFGQSDDMDQARVAADKAAAEQLALQEGEGEELMPRVHPSDSQMDFKSLDRKGKRNLYLLLHVKTGEKELWRFPQGGVEKGELLHQAAQRDLEAECGAHMDTWIVGRNPVGVYKSAQPDSSSTPTAPRTTFFFKAHIMAGQVKPTNSSVLDFAWLTKQEIEDRVEQDYWHGIKDILSDY